ncbi:hypothetical protein GYH30_043136 [Glycine max]|nr:hypothetical protein GYH30_043136 [Glycine max]
MLLVDAAGVEVTLDDIVRDVFVLENQIPIHVLMEISKVNINSRESGGIIEEHNLGESMLNFCRPLCPLVHSEQVSSRKAEDRAHLLDLVYHLTAPQLVSASESEQNPQPLLIHFIIIFAYMILWACLLLCIIPFYCITFFLYLLIFQVIVPLIQRVVRHVFDDITKFPGLGYFKSLVIVLGFPFLKRTLQLEDSTDPSEEVVTIPSALKLEDIGVKFIPAEGSITSYRYETTPLPMGYEMLPLP